MSFAHRLLTTCVLLFLAPSIALADLYQTARFTGAINGGGANVRAPFSGNGFTQGDTFSGSFVFDVQKIPGAGSGFTNVFFSSFPDIGSIPDGNAFNLTLDGLNFNLGNAVTPPLGTQEAAIQYKNGAFNGFFYIADFSFQGSLYQFEIQGTNIDVRALTTDGNPTGRNLINAHLDLGLSNLANFSLDPANSVPEPGSLGLLCLGLAGLASRRCKGADQRS